MDDIFSNFGRIDPKNVLDFKLPTKKQKMIIKKKSWFSHSSIFHVHINDMRFSARNNIKIYNILHAIVNVISCWKLFSVDWKVSAFSYEIKKQFFYFQKRWVRSGRGRCVSRENFQKWQLVDVATKLNFFNDLLYIVEEICLRCLSTFSLFNKTFTCIGTHTHTEIWKEAYFKWRITDDDVIRRVSTRIL